MKIEFLREGTEISIIVDGEHVGHIAQSYYNRDPRILWKLPLASNWPSGKEKEIVQAAMEKVAALKVAARLKS